jgi:hypothetical protein
MNKNIKINLADPVEDPCKPPYKRGHGGFCGCNCKCLPPECWDLVKIYYECIESSSPSPAENICGEEQKLCMGEGFNFCQEINAPCFGYDCLEDGCKKSPYLPGMYKDLQECNIYCDHVEKKLLIPHNIIIDGKRCVGGICPEQPDWICCLDGTTCAATYADCDCNCSGEKGCTNPGSPNYNPAATCDDGSCVTCCNSGKCENGNSRILGLESETSNKNLYAKDIIEEFNKRKVNYLICGSVARSKRKNIKTKNYRDIDILYQKTDDNINKIFQVLNKYEVLAAEIDHTIIPCIDIQIDLFSNIPYQNLTYENFKQRKIKVLDIECPAITKAEADKIRKPSDMPVPLPFIGDGLGSFGYCGNDCGLPGGPGPCHPTFSDVWCVAAENSCSGQGFCYDSCYGCYDPNPTDYITCYYCENQSLQSCSEITIPYSKNDFPDSPPDCSYFGGDAGFDYPPLYNTPEECMLGCYGNPDYTLCYVCIKIAIGGVCNAIYIPYTQQCGENGLYDNIDICESACQTTTTTTTTTTPEPECVIEVTTESCCLEYTGETIYSVGKGLVKAELKSEEVCCPDGTPVIRVNGATNEYFADDGETIEVTFEMSPCSCTEQSKEPSSPSDAGCPKEESTKPLIVLDKKTNKIKILINKKLIK